MTPITIVLAIITAALIAVNISMIVQLKSLNDKWEDFKAAFAKIGVYI